MPNTRAPRPPTQPARPASQQKPRPRSSRLPRARNQRALERASNLADFGADRRGRADARAGAVPPCPRPGVHVPRQTHDCDAAVLVRQHLPGFLARLEESGHSLPEFVKRELAEFAGCGDFERGFVQTVCRQCGEELRVPFSCKNRGFCPSCMGRRMAEGAALLVDHVLPAVGYRQWVLLSGSPVVRSCRPARPSGAELGQDVADVGAGRPCNLAEVLKWTRMRPSGRAASRTP